jgi:hypothetical protein
LVGVEGEVVSFDNETTFRGWGVYVEIGRGDEEVLPGDGEPDGILSEDERLVLHHLEI